MKKIGRERLRGAEQNIVPARKRARLLRALETYIVNPFGDRDQRNRKRFSYDGGHILFCAPFLKESFLRYLIFDPVTAAGVRVSFPMFVYFASAFCSRFASLDVEERFKPF